MRGMRDSSLIVCEPTQSVWDWKLRFLCGAWWCVIIDTQSFDKTTNREKCDSSLSPIDVDVNFWDGCRVGSDRKRVREKKAKRSRFSHQSKVCVCTSRQCCIYMFVCLFRCTSFESSLLCLLFAFQHLTTDSDSRHLLSVIRSCRWVVGAMTIFFQIFAHTTATNFSRRSPSSFAINLLSVMLSYFFNSCMHLELGAEK